MRRSLFWRVFAVNAGLLGGIAVLLLLSPIEIDSPIRTTQALIVVGGLGSVIGSVLSASLLVYLMEVLREFKSTQEIVFGALLVGFMVFQPNGLVVFLKRWLPGWEEPVHLAGPEGKDSARSTGKDAAPGEQPAAERA